MPKVVIAALAVIGALILFFGSFAISSAISHNWVSGLHWDNPSLADIPDGVYLAEYYHELPAGISAQVYGVKMNIRIYQHKFYNFLILEPQKYEDAFKPIISKVLADQTLQLDGMTGGTVTNSAFLIAASRAISAAKPKRVEEADAFHDPDGPVETGGQVEADTAAMPAETQP